MKLKLLNEADIDAAEEIAGLQKASLISLIASFGATQCSGDVIFTVVIHKTLLADSYKGNPSLFAGKIFTRLQREDPGEWQSCSGHLTSLSTVTVRFSKQAETRTMRVEGKPTAKNKIKDWLRTEESETRRLSIPHVEIPAWYLSHPEQLKYAVKQETGRGIKITKLSKSWLITRK